MAQVDRLREWIDDANRQIAKSYSENHEKAKSPNRIQESGHAAEASWGETLKAWLPPQYSFGYRKYILPEIDADSHVYRETDLVIYRPGYPQALREKSEVLAAGVLAAFSVKLTLDRKGLREAAEEAASVRRHVAPRLGTPRRELVLPFRYGVLAHSHRFGKDPREKLGVELWDADHEFSQHPRESLDLVCVADLGAWSKHTSTYTWSWNEEERLKGNLIPEHYYASTSFMDQETQYSVNYPKPRDTGLPGNSLSPLTVFLSSLYRMLAQEDPLAEPFSSGLIGSGLSGSASGRVRPWPLGEVYSEFLPEMLPSRIVNGRDPEWSMNY